MKPNIKTVYVVTAYRYGMRDAHSYVVSAHASKKEAMDAAEHEVEYRGGKYGCDVTECVIGPWDADRRTPQVAYASSPYEGMIGSGSHPADRTNEGWKERLSESLRENIKHQKAIES